MMMIVRLMGEGQYGVSDELLAELNELDRQAARAIDASDEDRLHALLGTIAGLIKERGERLDDAHLAPSDMIIPPADLTLDEAHALFAGEGLIPDLPVPG